MERNGDCGRERERERVGRTRLRRLWGTGSGVKGTTTATRMMVMMTTMHPDVPDASSHDLENTSPLVGVAGREEEDGRSIV